MATASRKTPRPRRRKETATQLGLWSSGALQASGRGDLSPTSVLLRQASCRRVLDQIRQVRLFFPELDEITIKVGLTRSAAGLASREEPWIWLNPRRLTRHTIAHEFIHLVQAQGTVPAGEKSADLHSLARDLFLVDDLPYYLRLPRSLRLARPERAGEIHRLLHQVARESLIRREGGHRTYLKWFEEEVDTRWECAREAPPVAAPVPMQVSLF